MGFGVEAFALDDAALAGVGRAVGNLQVVEVAEPAPYLFGGEEGVNGGERREEEEFLPWLEKNATRIQAAQQRGTLPYFIRDNAKFANITVTASNQPSNAASNQYRGENIVEKGRNFLIGTRFAVLNTHEKVAATLRELLRKNLGYDVEVVARMNLIDLNSAKAYATELERLSRQYAPRQGKLSSVKLGYAVSNPRELGEVSYNPLESPGKTLSLRTGYDIRYPDKAIESSRCDSKNMAHAAATHEFAHLLYQFRGKVPGQDVFFENAIQQIYEAYRTEANDCVKRQNMNSLAEIYIGHYGHDNGPGEFLAEAFQEYRNCKSPSKYAVIIGNLFETWFKR